MMAQSASYFDNQAATVTASATSTSDTSNAAIHCQGDSLLQDQDTNGFFEGPEKTMEVIFRNDSGAGLHALSRSQLDHLCNLANCSILSKISSKYLDAYVLSESSLVIYKYKFVMKTCGTTTLLHCLSTLLTYSDELEMKVETVVYSRKNLTYPKAQMWPYYSFGEEIKYIKNSTNLQNRVHGNGFILGPITADHFFIYVADLTPNAIIHSLPCTTQPYHSYRTINMMMFGLAAKVRFNFFQRNVNTGKDMTKKSGISLLCPGAIIDEKSFSPCGYSMNAIVHDAYYTVHVTPEEACSYASFETNTCLTNYSPLVHNVLKVFKPTRFVITMFGDETIIHSLMELPADLKHIEIKGTGNFIQCSQSSTKVARERYSYMAIYAPV